MPYLVDTDILIDMTRGKKDAMDYLDSLGDWAVSIVSGMEILAGAKDRREVREIDIMLATYRKVHLSEEIGQLAYNLMKQYVKSHGLDPSDALIAATAIREGLTLATRNRKHFAAIGGLEVETPGYG